MIMIWLIFTSGTFKIKYLPFINCKHSCGFIQINKSVSVKNENSFFFFNFFYLVASTSNLKTKENDIVISFVVYFWQI